MWHVNIRGVRRNLAELVARLRLATQKPTLVCVTESFLGRATQHVSLEGYELIARRDRDTG